MPELNLDLFGEPVGQPQGMEKRQSYETARPKGGPMTQQGAASFEHSFGYLAEKERNPKLRNRHKYELYSEIIANHPVVAAGMRAFLAVMQKTKWSEVPIEGDAESERQAAEIKEIRTKMETSWAQMVKRSSMFVYYGFGLQEWTAKKLKSGTIGIKSIEPRAQHTIERWDISDRGEIVGVEQRNPNNHELLGIDRRRLIYCVDDSLNDSPEGLGILRQLVATAERLDAYLLLEDIGFDTDLRGVPIVRAPLEEIRSAVKAKTMSVENANKKIEVLRGFVSRHERKKASGLLLDSKTKLDRDGKVSSIYDYSVELMSGDGSAQADLKNSIARCRQDLAMLLATGFLLLGEDGGGSLALSKTKMDSFMLFVESTLEYLSEVYKRDLFRQIARLNGWDEDSLPSLAFEAPKMQDIVDIVTSVRDMATASGGIDPADPIIDWIRTEIGAPKRPDDMVPEFGSLNDPDMGGPNRQPDNVNLGEER